MQRLQEAYLFRGMVLQMLAQAVVRMTRSDDRKARLYDWRDGPEADAHRNPPAMLISAASLLVGLLFYAALAGLVAIGLWMLGVI